MKLYFTSKNTGPSYNSDPLYLIYVGTDLDEAVNAVGSFVKYEDPDYLYNSLYPKTFSALPRHLDFEFVKFYMADGWWCSIVSMEIEEPKEVHNQQ